jgi:hypothetical protein
MTRMADEQQPGKERLVLDLTEPEDEDWMRVSQEGLVDLALSLPPGTDLMAYLREHPEMPVAKAVLSGQLEIPDDLPESAIGYSERVTQENLRRLRGLA